jgi:hypothetical protein
MTLSRSVLSTMVCTGDDPRDYRYVVCLADRSVDGDDTGSPAVYVSISECQVWLSTPTGSCGRGTPRAAPEQGHRSSGPRVGPPRRYPAILKTAFGYVAQDRSQAVQVAYLVGCVEEDATIEAVAAPMGVVPRDRDGRATRGPRGLSARHARVRQEVGYLPCRSGHGWSDLCGGMGARRGMAGVVGAVGQKFVGEGQRSVGQRSSGCDLRSRRIAIPSVSQVTAPGEVSRA